MIISSIGPVRKVMVIAVLAMTIVITNLQWRTAASADLQDGDFVVGVHSGGHGAIQRVRDGVATTYCESHTSYQFDPGYFDTPTEVVVDLQGRIVFLALLRTTSGNGLGAWGLWRCDTLGAPPTMLAAFGADPKFNYPDPLRGRPVRWAGGLHIKRAAGVNLNSGTAAEMSYYVLAVSNDFGAPVNTIALRLETGEWGEMDDPLQTQDFFKFDMINAGDGLNSYTVSAAAGAMKVIAEPVRLEFDIDGIGSLSLAFQSNRSLENAAIDDLTVGNADPSCASGLPPGVPRNSAWTANVMSGIHGVAWADDGLVMISDNLGAGHNYLPAIEMAFFNLDPMDDGSVYYSQKVSPDLCALLPSLQHTPWHPFNSYWDSFGVPRYARQMTPDGTAGSQRNEGRIVGVGPAQDVLIHAVGLTDPTGIDRYPGFKPKMSGLSLFVKIESPVNVVITAPDGRRIGVDPQTGLAVNDLGPAGYDSNTNEPHVYGIRNPIPGAYTIETVGTGVGPFHITTYGVNFETMAVSKTTFAGDTEPSKTSAHEFELTPTGGVVISGDREPPVITGATNLVVDATGPLTAVTYPALTVVDNLDPAPALTCAPASGSQFSLGTTNVACTATDATGNSSAATTFTVTVVPVAPPPDTDGDGVLDGFDACSATPAGEVINASGCAISQICPASAGWRNHGEYVSCVTRSATEFERAGLVTARQRGGLVSLAARSRIGK